MARHPNILFIQVDQMAAAPLPFHGGRIVRAPHLQALAEDAAIFEAAYCNSPICAPSRFSMMTGRLPTSIDAFDNASELPASRPTFAHLLARAGYHTVLSGKMHFIGPDQLHGFAERLTTDIYPADFAWTPNWAAGPRDRPSGISMVNVLQAGTCVRSLQMDYDDEVEQLAVQHLYDLARRPRRKPFFLAVSFSHPHPPYTAGREWWDRYRHDDIDLPRVAPIPVEQRDVHSQWLHASHGADLQPVSDEQVRNARHAYYANISYIDDKVGRLLRTLGECGMADDTIVVFTSDHGEMLGERGMWYKQTFFEPSVRVPLLVREPGRKGARRVQAPVSLVDLLPTLVDWAGGPGDWPEPVDGSSWSPLLAGAADALTQRQVVSEYTDMGVIAPARMVRRGSHKYIHTHGHPPQLFDLRADPDELRNLAGREDVAAIESELRAAVLRDWDGDAVLRRVLASQRRRLYLKEAAAATEPRPTWDYQAHRDDSQRFVRSHGAAGAKALARFPFVAPS
ncbi:choline-sulfatase [Ramlibacter sp. AN1133]|uniref:choline-sulfatase n=1 Tax=Ramlibacter sp. AN1133 TaxID=3133429 RepID=UPI0030BC04B9